jgi:hypothetical protein
MKNLARSFHGKKFIWGNGDYSTKEEAMEKISQYEKGAFETELVEEEAKYFVYTRRVVTEIILEEGVQPS